MTHKYLDRWWGGCHRLQGVAVVAAEGNWPSPGESYFLAALTVEGVQGSHRMSRDVSYLPVYTVYMVQNNNM